MENQVMENDPAKQEPSRDADADEESCMMDAQESTSNHVPGEGQTSPADSPCYRTGDGGSPTESPCSRTGDGGSPTESPCNRTGDGGSPIESPCNRQADGESPPESPCNRTVDGEPLTDRPSSRQTDAECPTESPSERSTNSQSPSESPSHRPAESPNEGPSNRPADGESTTEEPRVPQVVVVTCRELNLPSLPHLPNAKVIVADGNQVHDIIEAVKESGDSLSDYDVILYQICYQGLITRDDAAIMASETELKQLLEDIKSQFQDLIETTHQYNARAELVVTSCLPVICKNNQEKKLKIVMKLNEELEGLSRGMGLTNLPIHKWFVSDKGLIKANLFEDRDGHSNLNNKGRDRLLQIYNMALEEYKTMAREPPPPVWSCLMVTNTNGLDVERLPQMDNVKLHLIDNGNEIAELARQFTEEPEHFMDHSLIIFHLCDAQTMADEEKSAETLDHIQTLLDSCSKHSPSMDVAVTSPLPVLVTEKLQVAADVVETFHKSLENLTVIHGATYLPFYHKFLDRKGQPEQLLYDAGSDVVKLSHLGMTRLQQLYAGVRHAFHDSQINFKSYGPHRENFIPSKGTMEDELQHYRQACVVMIGPVSPDDLYQEGMREVICQACRMENVMREGMPGEPPTGYLELEFRCISAAEKAVERLREIHKDKEILHTYPQDYKAVPVEKFRQLACSKPPPSSASKVLVVFGLQESMTEEVVSQAFPSATQVLVPHCYCSRTRKCYGYVTFDTPAEMERHLKEKWCTIGDHKYEMLRLESVMPLGQLLSKLDRLVPGDWNKAVPLDSQQYKQFEEYLRVATYSLHWARVEYDPGCDWRVMRNKLEQYVSYLRKKLELSQKAEEESKKKPEPSRKRKESPDPRSSSPKRPRIFGATPLFMGARATMAGMAGRLHGAGVPLRPNTAAFMRGATPTPAQRVMAARMQQAAMSARARTMMAGRGGISMHARNTAAYPSPGGVTMQAQYVDTVQYPGGRGQRVTTVRHQMSSAGSSNMWQGQNLHTSYAGRGGGPRMAGPGGQRTGMNATSLVMGLQRMINKTTANQAAGNPFAQQARQNFGSGSSQFGRGRWSGFRR